MPIYEITVRGVPVAQPRPKVRTLFPDYAKFASLWKGSLKGLYAALRKSTSGQAYVPEKHAVHQWRRAIVAAVKASNWSKLEATPIRVEAVFLFPRPQNLVWKTRPMPRVWYDKKTNDIDNLIKAVLDAINDSEVWPDDGLVVDVRGIRLYAAGNESPGLKLRIETLPVDCPESVQPGNSGFLF